MSPYPGSLPRLFKGTIVLLVFFVAYSSLSTSLINLEEIENDGAGEDNAYGFAPRFLRVLLTRLEKRLIERERRSQIRAARNERSERRERRKTMYRLKYFHKSNENTRDYMIEELMNEVPKGQLLNRFDKPAQEELEVEEGDADFACKHTAMGNQIYSSCHKLLSEDIKSSPAWFFLGDAQMFRMTEQIQYPYTKTYDLKSDDSRCSFLDFSHLKKAKKWKAPPFKIVGPTDYGLDHPFCSDSGSWNTLRESWDVDGSNMMEFMQVPYAKSVEQQTDYTDTTQETAVMHIANQLQLRDLTYEDSVCVANSGLQDRKLCYGKDDAWCSDIYYVNVKSYIELLENVCGSIIWISTTPVVSDDPQTNFKIKTMNLKVKEILSGYENGYFVDIWDAASQHKYLPGDFVHFEPEYYAQLAKLFSSLM